MQVGLYHDCQGSFEKNVLPLLARSQSQCSEKEHCSLALLSSWNRVGPVHKAPGPHLCPAVS